MTLIAAVEAYRLTGWESTHKCIMDLYSDFQKVAEASRKVQLSRFIVQLIRMILLMIIMMEFRMFNKLMARNW